MSSCPVRYLGLKRERHSCHIRPGSIYRHWYHPHCKHSGAGYTQNQSHPHPRQIGSYRQIARKRQRHVDCKSVNFLECILKKKKTIRRSLILQLSFEVENPFRSFRENCTKFATLYIPVELLADSPTHFDLHFRSWVGNFRLLSRRGSFDRPAQPRRPWQGW